MKNGTRNVTILVQASAEPGYADLSWTSATGEYFTLEYRTNFFNGFTGIVQTNLLATPPENVITVPATNGSRFYRLRF